MKPRPSACPQLESLEDRCLPAFVFFSGGGLSVSNPLASLTVTQVTTNNTWKVQDGGLSYGPFHGVKAISISSGLGNHNTTVDLDGLTYTGSLAINAPGGNDLITFTTSKPGGILFGNVFITAGTGKDQLVIPKAITVNGVTQFNLGSGNDTLTVSGPATFNGTFDVNVTTGTDSIAFTNAAATINGNTYFLTGSGNSTLNLGTAFTINGDVIVNLGNGNDKITLDANLNGNLFVILGNGNNTLTINSAGPPTGTTYYSFYLTTGNGNTNVSLAPTASASWFLNWNFGTGSNTINLGGSKTETISGLIHTLNSFDFTFIQGANWLIVSYFITDF